MKIPKMNKNEKHIYKVQKGLTATVRPLKTSRETRRSFELLECVVGVASAGKTTISCTLLSEPTIGASGEELPRSGVRSSESLTSVINDDDDILLPVCRELFLFWLISKVKS